MIESMSLSIMEFLTGIPESFRLIVLALFAFAEGLPIIGSILPGGTIAILAGTLIEGDFFVALNTILVVSLFSFFGDMTGFLLGKRFKHLDWVQKIANNQKHQKNWDLFDRHIAIIAIFGKLIPVVRSTPAIFAGVRGIRIKKYIIYSLIGSFLWGVAGIYAGQFFKNYFGEKVIPFLTLVILASILFSFARPYLKFKRFSR